MCGRYSLTSPGELVAEVFGLEDAPRLEPRYNIAPTQEAAVVRVLSERDARQLDRPGDAGRRTLALLRWGLIPAWADDPGIGNRLINARAESAADKPAFRFGFERHLLLLRHQLHHSPLRIGRTERCEDLASDPEVRMVHMGHFLDAGIG